MLKFVVLGMLAGIGLGVVVSEATYYFLRGGEARSPRVVEITIPAGTGARIDTGESEPSLPRSMTFLVGDTFLVRNDDDRVHQLGPLVIPPQASASLKLTSAKKYAARCSFQPTRYMGLDVRAPLTLGTRLFGMLQAGVPLGVLFALYGALVLPGKKVEAA